MTAQLNGKKVQNVKDSIRLMVIMVIGQTLRQTDKGSNQLPVVHDTIMTTFWLPTHAWDKVSVKKGTRVNP